MIHHCSGSFHDHYKCFFYHSMLLWCSWGCIFKKISNSFLSDSLSRSLFSPALSHLIIITWISHLAFKAFIQSIIGSTCLFSFSKRNSSYTLLLHQKKITQICLPPMLGFLIDEMSKYILSPGLLLLSSFFFGIFFVLFSPMSSSGNY